MGKIIITRGYDGEGNASELHLLRNHLLDPTKNIDQVIHYAERRTLMTLLVSGVVDSRYTAPRMTGADTVKTRLNPIPNRELTSSLSWQYRIMGRIQKASEIIELIGTPTAGSSTVGGYFQLKMIDNSLVPGMVTRFANGKHARVTAAPTGSPGNYIYRFQCFAGDTFVWATWCGVQVGTKTCFGGYTTYGERSLRGYGRVFYPDTYINHMTTQRKGLAISGDANTESILWLEYNGERGWMYEAEAQIRVQFNLEDDYQKIWGLSNMKDSNGNLLSTCSQVDGETGEPMTAGDGWFEQTKGSNDFTSSGTSGDFTHDDCSDMITTLKKKATEFGGKRYYAMTGADGMANAHNVIETKAIQLGLGFDSSPGSTFGGASPEIGYNFQILNVAGNQIVFIENPQFDDEAKFPLRLTDGKLAQSKTVYFMDMSTDETGRPNMEIRPRGKRGINRGWVYFLKNGMTGDGPAQDSVDAKEIQMLKQDMFVVYNTRSSGILAPSPSA